MELNKSKEFMDGFKLAHEVATKCYISPDNGGYSIKEMVHIFGEDMGFSQACANFNAEELLERILEYEEEKSKPKRGDVVEVYEFRNNGRVNTGILTGKYYDDYSILTPNYSVPMQYNCHNYYLKKTGKHIDIDDIY